MKYYFRENIRRYEKMDEHGFEAWAEAVYGGTDLGDFSSRPFLELALPKLRHTSPEPTALELGTGVGPGALFLAAHGYRVAGYELIPEAVEKARAIAAERGLDIQYEVMDVTQIPHQGERFDLIVDSFCINHIVFAAERRAVFESVKARLQPGGYYLVSSSMYEPANHAPDEKIVDQQTGKAYDAYSGDCLYDPETDYFYEPLGKYPSQREKVEAAGDAFVVNGETYIPKRCYRNGARLRAELESYGFEALWQEGEYEENLVCVHRGSGVGLVD